MGGVVVLGGDGHDLSLFSDSSSNISPNVTKEACMPIIECKECKGQVSSDAKTCPHCGAKVPKQVGLLVGIFATLFVGFFIYESTRVKSTSTTSSSNVPSVSSVNEANVTPKKPASSWSITSSKDEMTGETSFFAVSESVAPTRPMDFPYSDVTAWIGVGCDGASEWAFFGFDQAPNLTGSETRSGYNLISTRIKWGDAIENIQ
ncbi:MAG: zinc ribbon domain-containing protein, partial [Pseudomonadota bacterium]|nr:zinc ribbon domain-containing protein [Pseudomonadota bacterium]